MADMLAHYGLSNTGIDALLNSILTNLTAEQHSEALALARDQSAQDQRRLRYWLAYLIARDSNHTVARPPASAMARLLDPDLADPVDFAQARELAIQLGSALQEALAARQASTEQLDQPDRPELVRAVARKNVRIIETLIHLHILLQALLEDGSSAAS